MPTPPPPNFTDIRCLVFDLDGTLIDSGVDLANSVNATVEKMGRKPLPHHAVFAFVGSGARRLVEQALGPGATTEEVERALIFFLGYYHQHMLDNTITYPGVREGLAALEGMPMAVLTNKPVRFSQHLLDGLGLSKYFRYVYGGNSFHTKKPDPAGMEVLLRDFGAAPRQAMLIGDSEIDVQTARNADTWSCSVTYGLGWERLADYPSDLIIDSLAELPAHLAPRPADKRRR